MNHGFLLDTFAVDSIEEPAEAIVRDYSGVLLRALSETF
jgi:hypothetical protein